MTEVEIGWAAGLFEGEGTVTRCNGRRRLAVKMTAQESVVRFAKAVGVGKVYGPYGPYESMMGRTPYYLWVAEGEDADVAENVLSPNLSEWMLQRLHVETPE